MCAVNAMFFLFELIFKKYFIWKETLDDIQIGTVSVIFKIALIL